MNAKQKLHQAHLQECAARFADQKASGLTVKQWCEQNHFSIHTYNYWKHLLKEEVVDQLLPDIVPVTVPVASDTALPSAPTTHGSIRANCTNRAIHSNGSTAMLTVNGISIEIDASVSEEFLRTLIRAVRYA